VSRLLVPALVFAVFLAGTAACQWHIYQTYKKPEFLLDRIFLLPQPDTMKYLAAGYESLLADLLWIRGIQYYGQHFSTLCKPPEKGRGLIGLFHTLVELDPDFLPAYRWGAFILTESMNDPERCPGGARRAIDEFLLPAMDRFPDDYTLPAEAGFVAFWHVGDNELAVSFFERAASIPRPPPNLERMIPYSRSREDSFPSLMFAYRRYLGMYLEPDSDSEKQIAEKHLRRIVVRFHQFHLKEAVEAYKRETGRPPAGLEDLVDAGVLLPVRDALAAYQRKTGRLPESFQAMARENIIATIRTDAWPIDPQDLAALPAQRFLDGLPVGPDGERYVYLRNADRVALRGELEIRQRDLIAFLNFYLAAFKEEYGRCPDDLAELVPEFVKEIPPDPLEMNRTIDPVDCTITVEVP